MWGDVYGSPLGTSIDSTIAAASVEDTNFGTGGIITRKPTTYDQTQNLTAFIDESVTLAKFSPPVTEDHWFLTNYRIPQAGDIFHANQSIPEGVAQIGGAIGGLWQGDFTFVNQEPQIVRGEGTNTGGVLHWGTTTATGTGNAVQFGTLSAGETLYAWLAVDTATIAGTSPTLAVLIERDNTDSWSGAETTVVTFSTATDAPANTYQLDTSNTGAETEPWYRVNYTITGSAGQSFRWFCGLGIV
jgi:hypothetical protein